MEIYCGSFRFFEVERLILQLCYPKIDLYQPKGAKINVKNYLFNNKKGEKIEFVANAANEK